MKVEDNRGSAVLADDKEGRLREGELVCVLETLDQTLIPVVSSLLEHAQIPFVVRGLGGAGLETLINRVAGLFSQRNVGLRVLVPPEFEGPALELLEPGDHNFEETPELAFGEES